MSVAFRRSALPTEDDLHAIPAAKMAEYELSDIEVGQARRFIYAQNREWMRTGLRYRTMREGSYLYVLKLD